IIKLKIIDNQSYNKLFTYFSLQKNTQYLKTCFGEWDLSVTVLTKDSFELKNIISEIRTELKEILDDIKVLMLFEEYKNDYFPKGILDTEK
ncbi:MAG: hypothetical protein KKH40_00095, partial [Nanoarchaeota archaeon]|nr:hypothetical protein [Nanoarchaeota archaeon]